MPNIQKKMVVYYVGYDVDSDLKADIMMPTRDDVQILARVAAIRKVNGYVPVAMVEYDDRRPAWQNLENAYKMMQNGVVTDSWTLSPPDGLTALVDPIRESGQTYGHRSMSMGDIVEYGGNQFVVATFGFRNAITGEEPT